MSKDWESHFYIKSDIRDVSLNGVFKYRQTTYYVISKLTDEIVFPKKRKYGYSSKMDACRGAAHIYRNIIKEIEENLLGKS